ncbi:hypothetical protein [Bacillus sp. GZT]|uniref:hypothetical protein n=1 Tax=Bacillus sp. GZT TaxID=936600 RepID=UPI0007A0C26E|nr:hypothetical protein [Bacillus sp. GZT]KYZ68274.1 hypothetical protein A3782_16575 [Bacillus sp. GZT]
MSINYNNYATLTDYMDRNSSHPTASYFVNNLTLIRGALIVGLAPKGHLRLSKELIEWKISTVFAFIDTSLSSFRIRNTNQLETSEKVTVAYFIGMIFAQIYIQRHHGVRHLEHLKNPGITPTSLPGDLKNPDLWGYNPITMNSYLVEAKGSTANSVYFENKYIRKADSQLRAITQIDYILPGTRAITFNRTNSNLEKIIVATHPNLNNEITQHVIDPIDESDKILKINGDEQVYKYYLNLIRLIKSEKHKVINIDEIHDVKFRVIELVKFNCFIGIVEGIYDLLEGKVEKERVTEEDLIDVNKSVNSKLDDIEHLIKISDNNEKISIGIDGVIVLAKSRGGI